MLVSFPQSCTMPCSTTSPGSCCDSRAPQVILLKQVPFARFPILTPHFIPSLTVPLFKFPWPEQSASATQQSRISRTGEDYRIGTLSLPHRAWHCRYLYTVQNVVHSALYEWNCLLYCTSLNIYFRHTQISKLQGWLQ